MAGFGFAGRSMRQVEMVGDVEQLMIEEPVEAPEAAVEPVGEPSEVVEDEKPHRKRARHPKGSEKGGEFMADDPATPENEAYEG